jgi:thiamine-phosphate pyrophosphorylase
MKSLAECRLYTFVDSAYLHGRKPSVVARLLCEGGADLIQLRAKDVPKNEVRELGQELLAVAEPAGVWLVINDHLDIAQEIGAPICHLGQEDFFDAGHKHVSSLFGESERYLPKIGLSTHAPAQAERAIAAGADYIAIGPVFPTPTKPRVNPVTLDYVKWAAAHVNVPWFAIGGINLENLDEVLAAGAKRICVVSAILNSTDVLATTREFRRRLPAR